MERSFVTVHVRLEPDLHEALRRAAADADRPIAVSIRRQVRSWLVAEGYLPRPRTQREQRHGQ